MDQGSSSAPPSSSPLTRYHSESRHKGSKFKQFALLLVLLLIANSSWKLKMHVGAKLVLWPERYEDESYLFHGDAVIADDRFEQSSKDGDLLNDEQRKKNRRGKIWSESSSTRGDTSSSSGHSSIRNRLRLFHGQDDDNFFQTQQHQNEGYSSYLSKFVRLGNLMFQYIQNRLYGITSPDDDASQSASSYAYSLFQQSRCKDMIAEPRDAWEGLVSAFMAIRHGYVSGMHSIVDSVYELGHGSISAFVALWQGFYDSKHGIISPTSLAFVSELAYGLRQGAYHAADGFVLFTAGALVGMRNLIVGIARTPEAVRSSRLGMLYFPQRKRGSDSNERNFSSGIGLNIGLGVWDYYSLDSEDKEVQIEEEKFKAENSDFQSQTSERRQDTRSLRGHRRGISVKDSKYYDVLGVSTDANSTEIRAAYRREALRRHPDKQSIESSSAGSTSTPVEGFLDLTQAYRVLSDESSRNAYDEFGVCFEKQTHLNEDFDSTQDLLDGLFGTDAVKNYVGNIQIAAIVNEVFGFGKILESENRFDRESEVVRNLEQRRRVLDIAKYLRDRVGPYVRGEMTKEQLTLSCRNEARFILSEGGEFSVAFLTVIGRTLLQEADRRIGHVMPFVRKISSDFCHMVSSKVAFARVYMPIYFRVALEGMVLPSYGSEDNDDSGDCSGGNQHNNNKVDQGAILDLLWQYVVNDTVHTLRDACVKVFADRGVMDTKLAFVQTPSLLKTQRAEAIKILAKELLAASVEGRGEK